MSSATATRPSLRPLTGANPDLNIEAAAERDGLAWAMQHREKEAAGFAFEDRQFAAPDFIPDGGSDFRDAADSTCISFASPSIGERDPNADIHDRHLGCFDR